MIRYLIWKLRFEACNVKRLFGHGEDRLQYLAFGANLSDAVMKKRRITPLAARPFTLRDHGLRFDHPAPWAGCGYASAEPAPGEAVHGFLYTLSGRDAARMDFYEVVPVLKRYRRTVIQQDGVELFFYQTNRSTQALKPTEEYLGYIVKGLEAHPDASAEYRDVMAATETGVPGKFVANYFRERPGNRADWAQGLIDFYQRLSLVIFLKVIYRYSPTAPLIRPGSGGISNSEP
ncbi:MAG: gamma-glutamylcyclotransferase [Gammaproteobacteria bacterium]|nr:gamma-glutamylcyclotransferase [Gammaproteobacteria bacterium]